MSDIPTAQEIEQLLTVMAPGLVALGVRQSFIPGPNPDIKERVIAYAAFSAVYYALANPIGIFLLSLGLLPLAWHAAEYVAIPLLIGALGGVITQKDLLQPVWNKLRLHPMHHAPSAWDYAFSRLNEGKFIIVTLKNGSTIAGAYASGSFASSDKDERDILINEMWSLGDDGFKPLTESRSILVDGSDIQTIEFYKGDRNE